MNKKKKLHPVLKVLFLLFIVYLALFIASSSGYYEGRIRDKVSLTNDSIKDFEEKLASGEKIDITAYINKDEIDYSNEFSKLGDYFTEGVQVLIEKSSKIIGNILKTLF